MIDALEHFLGHYHDRLVHYLHALGEDPGVYPYRDLVKDYRHRIFFGFVIALQGHNSNANFDLSFIFKYRVTQPNSKSLQLTQIWDAPILPGQLVATVGGRFIPFGILTLDG